MTGGSRRALLLPLLAAACAPIRLPWREAPKPDPGAALLARPPAARIAIPPPPAAGLDDAGSNQFARELAAALLGRELPAVAGPGRRGDWTLAVTAEIRGSQVVLDYAIEDEEGRPRGAIRSTTPVDAGRWSGAGEAVLRDAAGDAAPRIAELIARVEAASRAGTGGAQAAATAGPRALLFTGVTGAPGDGNQSLARAIRSALAENGVVLTETKAGAGASLTGEVAVAPHSAREERVEIVWTVVRSDGEELGKVVQLNTVPKGTLGRRWGDVAFVVAQEAAAGVRDVIRRAYEGS